MTAVKVFRKPEVYQTELECYLRFLRHNVTKICGYSVPRLVDYAHDLLALEIDVVQPPRILDFGKVRLDTPWDYSEETMSYWTQSQEDLWEEHWPTIRRILAYLRTLGIYYADPNPYNIMPENWDSNI